MWSCSNFKKVSAVQANLNVRYSRIGFLILAFNCLSVLRNEPPLNFSSLCITYCLVFTFSIFHSFSLSRSFLTSFQLMWWSSGDDNDTEACTTSEVYIFLTFSLLFTYYWTMFIPPLSNCWLKICNYLEFYRKNCSTLKGLKNIQTVACMFLFLAYCSIRDLKQCICIARRLRRISYAINKMKKWNFQICKPAAF